jgi:tetratricopeptide (TPR) repeat protein
MIFAISKGQIRKAIEECSKQVEKSPKDKRLRLKLGDLYLKNGDNEKAIKEYLQTGELYAKEDLNTRAIAIYKRVVSIDPKHIEAFRKIATLYSKDGLWGSAKTCYEKILEIKPDDQEALNALSMTKESQQSKQIQIKAQEEGSPTQILSEDHNIPFNSEDLETHYHLGIGYKEMGLLDYAIGEFELASGDRSRKFDCCIMLGECSMEKGDFEQSIRYFKQASGLKDLSNDARARIQFNLGLAYEAAGMLPEALHAFHSVMKLDHTFLEVQEKIERLQERLQR